LKMWMNVDVADASFNANENVKICRNEARYRSVSQYSIFNCACSSFNN